MKQVTGTVVSTKMVDSATVLVERMWKHPLYQKTIKRSKKYLVNNVGKNVAQEGDTVVIQETKPMSKNKRWEIVKIVK